MSSSRSLTISLSAFYLNLLTIRILTQWSDQLYYLQRHRGFPWGFSHLFLLINVAVSI